MTKLSVITRGSAKELGEMAKEVLQEVADKYGLTVKLAGGKFAADNATLKFEFSTMNTDGSANTPEVTNFNDYANSYGLTPGDLGRKFVVRGKAYELMGCRPRSYKYPMIGKSLDGIRKSFKFTADSVKNNLV